MNLGELLGSLMDLDQSLLLEPGLAEAYANRALVNALLGNLPAVAQDLDRAVALGADRAVLEEHLSSLATTP